MSDAEYFETVCDKKTGLTIKILYKGSTMIEFKPVSFCCKNAEDFSNSIDKLQEVLKCMRTNTKFGYLEYADHYLREIFNISPVSYNPYTSIFACDHHSFPIKPDYTINFEAICDMWYNTEEWSDIVLDYGDL